MMKIKLDVDKLLDDFFEDACLLGIVAPVKDYQFAWHINQTLGFNFILNHSIEIPLKKKGRDYYFSIYEYLVPGTSLAHYLYNNEDDGEYLLPEFKHLDFLWLTKGEMLSKTELQTLIQSLRLLPSVQLVTEMTNEKIKNKQHLIF
ncbi:IPExxxVDY family protein [Ferruginibacter yonginensis]|uniref:IPExxxVDY family protein n=1 Tax=Ferruginibacter yonginensis TaxID=1310416 RepID=A0ABV8QUC6_9BACT